MNYHDLTRRELQSLCKHHKLPANKSNVAMADALTTLFLAKSERTSPAPGQSAALSTAKKPGANSKFKNIKSSEKTPRAPGQSAALSTARKPGANSKVKNIESSETTPPAPGQSAALSTARKPGANSKVKNLETSLAALILSTEKRNVCAGNTSTAKKAREIFVKRSIEAELPLHVLPSTNKRGGLPLPKTTPLRRGKKKSEVCLATGADNTSCGDEEGELKPVQQEVTKCTVTVVEAPDSVSPLAAGPNETILCAGNQEICKKSSSRDIAMPSISPLLRIRCNVDAAIERATGMLERFEQWKATSFDSEISSFSARMQVYVECEESIPVVPFLDKENNGQLGPCKPLRQQKLPNYFPGAAQKSNQEEVIMKDCALNVRTHK